ncbi:ankyrin repeat domain-containing protein [Skeletonema marinoi]|uniref:Ankyrin repeat domain-containing protein n=1 Tax=Skeletonema marinoi TaxID=267567 RepID=A0AAD8YLS0_9STRA|nr:ankyrin repeat domain-containing protein [Skeletonema marinoi]
MAEEIPFDEICGDPRQLDDGCWDHQEVSEVNHQSNIDENNAAKKSYLGTRRDKSGRWVRRHCSEKRYPRMAGKVNASSPLPSPSDRGSKNNEPSRHENKQSPEVRGRPSSSSRQQRRQQQKQKQQQQEQQLSSRQSDHSQQQQPLHIEHEKRIEPEVHSYIHKNHTTRSSQVYKPIPPLSKPKPSQTKAPRQFIEKNRQGNHDVVEAPTTGRRQTKQKKHKLIFDVSSFQSNQNDRKAPAGDEISGLFTTNTKMTSATRQSSLGSDIDNNDEERIRRFGDAYTAIRLAHQVNEVKSPEPRPSYSGKRWARDPKIMSAMSIDGRSYSDLQRTPTLSLKQMMTSPDVYDPKKGMLNVELYDRKASWLVHMPRTSPKYSSDEKERSLFQVKEESATNEEEFSSPDRKETATERITPLTPCLQKLNDIETKIQAIEKGQKFDLEENRRAIVQAGLPPRQKLAGQRDGTASSADAIRRFNQLTIEEESTAEEEQKATPMVGRTYDNNSTEAEAEAVDDNNSGIDNTPIVSASTLRLLFSGKSEDKQINDSNENTNTVKYETTKSMPRNLRHMRSFPTSSNGHNSNHIDGGKSDEKSTPPNPHNEFEERTSSSAQPFLRSNSSDGYSFNHVEDGKSDTDILLRLDPSMQRPDPPDSISQNLKEAYSSQREELVPQINVANLVRASLVVHARSFIDTDGNLDDFDEEEEQTMTRSMLMSPSLITKRYQQVLGAIEAKNWEQVSYLTHANPWLMEMKDVRNDQYLIHSLALYSDQLSIQEEIVLNILDYEPGVVHRLDTEGYLPLHMAAASGNIMMIKVLGEKFPAAASVQNHDGLLPLHLAVMSSGALRGDVGVSIISRLLQVHEDILTRNPLFLKETSVVTLDDAGDEDCFLSMMKNNRGETPLVRAIKSRAGRQVVDILLGADGGSLAALDENSSGASALHLFFGTTPSAAAIRDVNRILPIELACANSLQREIILAIAIIDLPIDLGAKEDVIVRNGFGASWWFLLCESNDEYVDIVKEILVSALREGLRFLGRFEFTGGDQNNLASSRKVQKFDAIDYGPVNNPSSGEKKVSLICYGSNEVYLREAKHLQESQLDMKYYEEFKHFAIGELDDANIPSGVKLYHCVAVSKSKLSLSRVVAGMPRNHEYRADLNLLKRYFSKVKSIMFRVGEGIFKLHACGPFSMTRLGAHSPPEAFVSSQKESSSASKNPALVAESSVDIWAFGKLIYEALWGNQSSHQSGIGALGIDLVNNCLRMEPNTRPRSMANILQHEFWKEKY